MPITFPRSYSIAIAARLALLVLAALCWLAAPLAAADTLTEYKDNVRPLLKRLCFDCHGPDAQEGDIRVDTLNPDLLQGSDEETWHDALNRLNLGEMPPPESTQPTGDERRRIVEWITGALRRAAEARRYADGRVVVRRLTRYEYQNTMRELLGVELDYARDLPPEPLSADGFLNNGATLEMSPLQLETYLAAARQGLAEAIVSGERPQEYRLQVTETAVGKLPTGKVAGHEPTHPEFLVDIKEFPRRGRFTIRIRAGAIVPPGHDYPRMRLSLGSVPGIIHVPRKLIAEVDVTATVDEPATYTFTGRMEDFPQPGDTPFGNVAFNGMVALIDFVDADGKELHYKDRKYPQPPPQPKKKGKGNQKDKPEPEPEEPPPAKQAKTPNPERPDIFIEQVEFESLVFDSWPPASHTQILFASETSVDESLYVREVLRRFMTRAYRRPATDEEIARTAELFDLIRPRTPTFEEAIRETLASVLVSPHFLYLVETREANGSGERITDYELATRLSYFLWSGPPDDRLFELAAAGKLHEPPVLQGELARMLEDERSREFATRLADQWFDLDALDRVAINPEFNTDFTYKYFSHTY